MQTRRIRDWALAFGVVGLAMSLAALDFFGMGGASERQSDSNFQSIDDALTFWRDPSDQAVTDSVLIVEFTNRARRGPANELLEPQEHTFQTAGWPLPISTFDGLLQRAVADNAQSLFLDVILGVPRKAEEADFCLFAHHLAQAANIEVEFNGLLLRTLYDVGHMGGGAFNPDCLTVGDDFDLSQYVIDPHSRQGQTMSRIEEIVDYGGLPVFLGATVSYLSFARTAEDLGKDMSRLSRERRISTLQQQILDQVAVLVSVDTYRQHENGYVPFPQNAYLSPALAMAYAQCREGGREAACHASETLSNNGGSRVAPHYLGWDGQATKAAGIGDCVSGPLRFHKALATLLYGMIPNTEVGNRVRETTCRRFETVSLACVMDGSCKPTGLFTDRHLLLGTSLNVLGDQFTVPVRGVVPGVDIHATAFEGLLREAGPKSVPGKDGSTIRFFSAIGLTFILSYALRKLRRRATGDDQRDLDPLPAFAWLLSAIPVITACKLGIVLATFTGALSVGVGFSAFASLEGPLPLDQSFDGIGLVRILPETLAAGFLLILTSFFAAAVQRLHREAIPISPPSLTRRGMEPSRVVRILLQAVVLLLMIGFLLVPLFGGTGNLKGNPFGAPIYAVGGTFALGGLAILFLIAEELSGRTSIRKRELSWIRYGEPRDPDRFTDFLDEVRLNIAERLHFNGVHLFALGTLVTFTFVIAKLVADWHRLPPSNMFAFFFCIVAVYWITFRERVQPDFRLGASALRRQSTYPPDNDPGTPSSSNAITLKETGT